MNANRTLDEDDKAGIAAKRHKKRKTEISHKEAQGDRYGIAAKERKERKKKTKKISRKGEEEEVKSERLRLASDCAVT